MCRVERNICHDFICKWLAISRYFLFYKLARTLNFFLWCLVCSVAAKMLISTEENINVVKWWQQAQPPPCRRNFHFTLQQREFDAQNQVLRLQDRVLSERPICVSHIPQYHYAHGLRNAPKAAKQKQFLTVNFIRMWRHRANVKFCQFFFG